MLSAGVYAVGDMEKLSGSLVDGDEFWDDFTAAVTNRVVYGEVNGSQWAAASTFVEGTQARPFKDSQGREYTGKNIAVVSNNLVADPTAAVFWIESQDKVSVQSVNILGKMYAYVCWGERCLQIGVEDI